MSTPDRGNNGRYTRGVTAARRDARAAELRTRGLSYQQIADQLGYTSRANAYRAVARALAEIVAEPAAELRALELARLDAMARAARAVLEGEHWVVSHGRVVEHDGRPLVDDAPVLHAIDRLLAIQTRRARLLGLDAPAKVRVITEDLLDREIERLTAEVEAMERDQDGGDGGS